jgi:hypothetical protein
LPTKSVLPPALSFTISTFERVSTPSASVTVQPPLPFSTMVAGPE